MGNPAYDARREAERMEAEKEKASAEAARAAFDALTAFMQGRASISLRPVLSMSGGTPAWDIRLIRDQG